MVIFFCEFFIFLEPQIISMSSSNSAMVKAGKIRTTSARQAVENRT
jgi:hypothetical protein